MTLYMLCIKRTAELLARTGSTFFDVLIVFFGGLAGIIGQTDKTRQTQLFQVLQLQPH